MKTPRYIKPETIRIGDVIRVTHHDEDAEYGVKGRVMAREHATEGTFWKTATDKILLYRDRAMNTGATVTLIESAAELENVTLEGL